LSKADTEKTAETGKQQISPSPHPPNANNDNRTTNLFDLLGMGFKNLHDKLNVIFNNLQ